MVTAFCSITSKFNSMSLDRLGAAGGFYLILQFRGGELGVLRVREHPLNMK